MVEGHKYLLQLSLDCMVLGHKYLLQLSLDYMVLGHKNLLTELWKLYRDVRHTTFNTELLAYTLYYSNLHSVARLSD